jgi:HlyD family secretion protein
MKFLNFFFRTKRRIIISITGIIILAVIIGSAVVASKGTTYQFVSVKKGDITETVSVTGNTTSTRSVSLAFQAGGIITSVNDAAGDFVRAGDVVATVNTSDLRAQLQQAEANVDAQTAKLEELQVGPTTASVNVSEANLAAAEQSLQNAYLGVPNTVSDGFAKSNDAVRNQIASMFTNAESNTPAFNVSISDSQIINNTISGRVSASTALNAWQKIVVSGISSASQSSLDTSLQASLSYLLAIKSFLNTLAQALTEATNIQASQLAAYQTEITNAQNEVNTAATNIQTAIQNIASEKAAVAQQQAQLQLTLASSTPQDIAAQQAQIEQAQASVASIQAKLNESSLVSPISGVVTVQNAKIGELASPGDPLVSIIANNQFEVDLDVPEIDIGKIAVGDIVSMTFDAFPGETFSGKLFYINPAETVTQGVVNYQAKISFDKTDSRLKSGLTANCDITTKKDVNALILPQYAILQNDKGAFVETVTNGKINQIPVTLGVQDENGNVEILSGVTENEEVLNIGLKTQ